jgi:hypothetical protein
MLSDTTIELGTAVFVLSRSSQPFGPSWVATLASDTSISVSEIISILFKKDIGARIALKCHMIYIGKSQLRIV